MGSLRIFELFCVFSETFLAFLASKGLSCVSAGEARTMMIRAPLPCRMFGVVGGLLSLDDILHNRTICGLPSTRQSYDHLQLLGARTAGRPNRDLGVQNVLARKVSVKYGKEDRLKQTYHIFSCANLHWKYQDQRVRRICACRK